MKPHWNILLLGALALSLTACQTESSSRRQIVTASVLRKGTITGAALASDEYPRHRQHIWTSDNPKHGCDVTISYRGTDQCQAYLEYVSPEDKPVKSGTESEKAKQRNNLMFLPVMTPFNPNASRHAGAGGATITLQNVTDVRLVCGNPAYPQFDECFYTIADVDCSRRADQAYLVKKPVATLKHVEMPCYTRKQVVWTGKPCNVTALLKGSAFAPARVWTSDAKGNVIGFQFAGAQPTFVTFRDIAKLEMECGSSSDKAGGNCELDIIQTECDK